MNFLYGVTVFCFAFGESESSSVDEKENPVILKANATTEQKRWNIKLDIYFSRTPPPVVRKVIGQDVKLKCEAIMNFTKVEKYTKNRERIETSLSELPPEHIQQTLMKNLKVYWLKDNIVLLDTHKINISTKIDTSNGTIATSLKIKNINTVNDGNYTCVIKQNYEKKQTTRLIVEQDVVRIENYEIPTNNSLANGKSDEEIEIAVKSTPNLISEDMKAQNETALQKYQKLEPICQQYVGRVCAAHLTGHFVYIPYDTTQAALEEKLTIAFRVTKYSKDISSHCEGFAVPSLCFSTFPICRDPLVTNENFMKEAKILFTSLTVALNDQTNTSSHDSPEIVLDKLPSGALPHFNKNMKTVKELLNYRYNTTVLRRVCKQDCEILENELCQTEYAIAKRHPHIGQQLTLEDCQDLPEEDSGCLKIDIGAVMVSDDDCYWENGSGYLGRVNISSSGMPCIEWSKQWHVKVSNYPELAGRHSYCRNPGGIKSRPWCIVDKDGKTEQFCDIPKCAHKIWIYILVIFLLLASFVIGFGICICYKNKNKANASTIRDMNLPNADKNIYGNSRLNSPIEMSELLTNQNMTNQPHLTRSTRGGALRIPQYSLAQIKFLEELGEGAFGKVYKGALKNNGETQYVAVKALKENASTKTKADFRREIDLISELTHDNIVCIVGVALKEEPLCMLFEFMARGDLHEFLMGRAPPSGKGLPAMRLLNIAQNIASGMQYLASHHYVHRDLAARNCLVSDDFVVKISDFGLSRDIYSSDYYRVQSKSLLPVRWMPPESILYGKFTTESDIWSYGVVLWEIYSYGLQPYYGYSNQEVIAMVRGGELLAAPGGCAPAVYALMRDCWQHAPQRRPNFDEIVDRIQEWIAMGGCPETGAGGAEASGGGGCAHRPRPGSSRGDAERVPLLPPHCSASSGSLAGAGGPITTGTGSLRSSGPRLDDGRSTCSEVVPPLAPKTKKHSAGSLVDADATVARETVVRIPSALPTNEVI